MGANAIHAMLVWMQQVLESGSETSFARNLTINPREIRGGAGQFMVAEQCEAAIDIHVPPGVDKEAVDNILEEARLKAHSTHPRCELKHENLYWASGYSNDAQSSLLKPIREAYNLTQTEWTPGAFRSHSDGSLFKQKGSFPVLCGPGRLEVAHTRHEHVSLDETKRAARLYAAMIYETCVR